MPHLNIIVAAADGGAIGYRNQLLYHLRDDLRRFKTLTTGNTIVMGRNTFLSLPKGALPNRRNVVLSRQAGASFPGCDTFTSLEAALRSCAEGEQVFIIGGAMLYNAALPLAERLYLTRIYAKPANADVFLRGFNPDEWRETWRESHKADTHNDQPFDFIDYVRINR